MENSRSEWIVIGVSGVTCGGKTTLANRLKDALSPVYVFHQDKYFYPDDSPKHQKCPGLEHNNYDIISSLDMDTMFRDILATIEGDNKCHAHNEEREGRFEIKGKKFLVVEGFTVLNYKPIVELCDLRYYFVLEYGACVSRRALRLYEPPDVAGYFDTCVWPQHLKYRAEIASRHVQVIPPTVPGSGSATSVCRDPSLCWLWTIFPVPYGRCDTLIRKRVSEHHQQLFYGYLLTLLLIYYSNSN